jgi:DNA-binding IclR family transcriptional regulator
MSEIEKSPPLERYIRILELLSVFPSGLSQTHIATMLDLPKPTVHRLIKTMLESKLVDFSHLGAFSFVTGRRLHDLLGMKERTKWVEILAKPYLRQLAEATGETSYIARFQGAAVRSILTQAPETAWRGFVSPGRIMQAHAAASAKAIFAFREAEVVDMVLADPLEPLTVLTTLSKSDVLIEYAKIRETGFATCVGEIDDNMAAVAVPIRVPGMPVTFSLALTGPRTRIVEKDLAALAEVIAAFAEKVSASFAIALADPSKHDGTERDLPDTDTNVQNVESR